MKIGSLEQDVVTETFDHNGEPLVLQIDRNVVSRAFLKEVGEQLNAAAPSDNGHGSKKKKKKAATNGDLSEGDVYLQSAKQLDQQMVVYTALLSKHLIKGWDLTEDDGVTPIAIESGLARLAEKAPMTVVSLWEFAMDVAQGPKKTNTKTTLPDIDNGSSETPEAKSMDAPTT